MPGEKSGRKGCRSRNVAEYPSNAGNYPCCSGCGKNPRNGENRLGWDANNKIIVELAEQLQDCGIAALTIHGRTRAQMYTGEADWTLIGRVKNNPLMKIPVIGNGDIDSPQRRRRRLTATAWTG